MLGFGVDRNGYAAFQSFYFAVFDFDCVAFERIFDRLGFFGLGKSYFKILFLSLCKRYICHGKSAVVFGF